MPAADREILDPSMLAFLGDPSAPDVRGLNGPLCIYPRTASGAAPPMQFQVQLDDAHNVTLSSLHGWGEGSVRAAHHSV